MTRLRAQLSAIRYRVGGLPVSLAHFAHPKSSSPADVLRHVHARRYWRIRSAGDLIEMALALLLLPVFVVGAAAWHTARCGPVNARRIGRPALLQFADQLRLYAATGIMPATYYIFSLPDEPTVSRARSFLKRAETKGMIYGIVRERMPPASSLNDKAAFEARCRAAGLPVIPTIAVARDGRIEGVTELPEQDLFVKPLDGKGGRGAERWTWLGSGRFRSADGEEVSSKELLQRIGLRSRRRALIVQPRIANHEALSALNCGALATFRG